ncbi:hypothetical protein M9H77_17936 [Catharanthus roseus]|uniref:Uncharacterized protein n=1 Tax=Catharanthus roseus TaxID=4058 RepID=A0ACC0B626_CATRO|nr:hypothetical protein M9H77_17936 [Catharanthus roseus]
MGNLNEKRALSTPIRSQEELNSFIDSVVILDLREGFMPEECKGEEEPSTKSASQDYSIPAVCPYRDNGSASHLNRKALPLLLDGDSKEKAAQTLFSLQLSPFLSSADKGKQDPPWPQPANRAFCIQDC